MAVFRFSKYKICYLLMSQPNLCSGAVAIQHKMLSRLLTYRKEKMRLISQLLAESCKKKKTNPIRKPPQYWMRPESTYRWWLLYKCNTKGLNWKFSNEWTIYQCSLWWVQQHICKKDIYFRKAVSVKSNCFNVVLLVGTSTAFGLAKSTVSLIVHRVCNAITINLTLRNIKLPSTKKEFDKSVALFHSKHRFPQCLGAAHGTHIQIKKPDEN